MEPDEPKFTGFVFKITANIDPNHRSCIAFCKICSGKFSRNTPYYHVRHDKTMRFSSPTQFMAQRKTTVDEAWAGDIIGLPDNGTFKIGDTLTEGEKLHFRGIPSFSPEMFKYIENADPMKQKQLAKGIDQLMDEGVAQLFINQFNGRKIIGTVGQLQFEVIQYRLENEYNVEIRLENLPYEHIRWIENEEINMDKLVGTSDMKIVKEGMYSWLIAIMYFKWHKWTSSILSSILPVSFNLLLEVVKNP